MGIDTTMTTLTTGNVWCLNLPGWWGYNPELAWVFKIRYHGNIVSDIYIYIEAGSTTGWTKVALWQASHQFASTCFFLGVQDASRKHTEPSQVSGPWAGSVVHMDRGE
jgi:hypothetical protein